MGCSAENRGERQMVHAGPEVWMGSTEAWQREILEFIVLQLNACMDVSSSLGLVFGGGGHIGWMKVWGFPRLMGVGKRELMSFRV